MSHIEITKNRVLELIEIYGAEPGAWPEEERAAAIALTEQDPDQFAEALQLARKLDVALAIETYQEPSQDLAERILASAPKPKRSASSQLLGFFGLFRSKSVRWPAGATLASLAVGIVGGYAYASTGTLTHDDVNNIYLSALGYDAEVAWATEEAS
ncbi:MAG: hypothetical protein Hens3KO_04380 [Henriciella sp.]